MKTNSTKEQALQKAKQYCAYRERCHSETKNKLFEMGLHSNEVDEIMSLLVEENYLNEERFAIQFTGGHFRIKQWGKNKIRMALKQKQISDYCIKKAMNSIPGDDYEKTVKQLFNKKLESLQSEKNIFIKKRKLQDYLLQKGFELHLISELMRQNFNRH